MTKHYLHEDTIEVVTNSTLHNFFLYIYNLMNDRNVEKKKEEKSYLIYAAS